MLTVVLVDGVVVLVEDVVVLVERVVVVVTTYNNPYSNIFLGFVQSKRNFL